MKLNFCRVMRSLAQRHGDKEAIVNVERNRRYSFRQYHLLTNRIANALRDQLAIGRGDKFMLILENDNVSLMQTATMVVSRMLWKFPGGGLRACEGLVFQAARSRGIGLIG